MFRQELKSDSGTIFMEYNQDGSLRAIHLANRKNECPKRLYNAIPLPMIVVSESEVVYWMDFAKDSLRILYYPVES